MKGMTSCMSLLKVNISLSNMGIHNFMCFLACPLLQRQTRCTSGEYTCTLTGQRPMAQKAFLHLLTHCCSGR